MSFEDNGSMVVAKSLQECKPDYEQQAGKMKLKVEAATNLKKAMLEFRKKNGIYEFKKIASFAEMLGGVELIKIQTEESYAEILKLIEETQ